MRFKGLDLNLLVALDALLTHQNVTVAAERVSMSQSAMSGALARLREHFEDELLVQVRRRMVLTPLAQSLAMPLRSILMNTSRFLDIRSGFDPATDDRRFTISCSDYVWAILITQVLRRAAMQAPHIQISYAGTSSQFNKSEIDLLIAPEGFTTENDPQEQLFSEEYVCVVCPKNTLVRDEISERQFFELGHVVAFSDRRTYVQEWFYRRFGETMKVAAIAPSFTLVPLSVVGTNHLAIVPLRLAKHLSGHLQLRIIPPPIAIPMMVDFMQWRTHQSEDPGISWLRGLVKTTAQHVFESN
jgi:LysR family transcriptional regulator, nod-box dependent transcriptional activator